MSAADPSQFFGFIPHLSVRSSREAIAFYQQAFGAELLHCMSPPDDERVMHACIRIDDQFVFLADHLQEFCDGKQKPPTELGATSVTLHRNVPDVDAAFGRALDAGATVRTPPTDMFWGDRYALVVDPFGHSWAFATHQQDLTPDEMHQAMIAAFGTGEG